MRTNITNHNNKPLFSGFNTNKLPQKQSTNNKPSLA